MRTKCINLTGHGAGHQTQRRLKTKGRVEMIKRKRENPVFVIAVSVAACIAAYFALASLGAMTALRAADPDSMVGLIGYLCIFVTFFGGFVLAFLLAANNRISCALATDGIFLVLLILISIATGGENTVSDMLAAYGTAVAAAFAAFVIFGLRKPNTGKKIKKLGAVPRTARHRR